MDLREKLGVLESADDLKVLCHSFNYTQEKLNVWAATASTGRGINKKQLKL